ncbi:ribbon-helix-helix domain-containing protein [Niveibacterium microcysteis]|uniref:Ribbon-helix-helix domain-containing protein n=1 Tax=Niveibacterium microcysteis TaxID=2811415 RepID=A0ABX7M4J8_9RHOO|nr:ribbon-helix-helix domain-containing protein [Niveibacterium microcysteis]QSI76671.1 ribbon-helix-helix domain-containing protein [Niveibacterium microcysteis]
MCQVFIGADAALYQARARSLRLRGVSTSIRLENLFWRVLEDIGARDGLSLSQLIAKLYDELAETDGDLGNFTSFLRVSCLRYLSLQLLGAIPQGNDIPIASLDATRVLAAERALRSAATQSRM